MNALELQGLTKKYRDFTLGPLDLTVPGGTICGLIGENGAGKSTTIRLILDMVQRDGGTVTILGRDNRADPVGIKEEIGVVMGSDGIPLCLNAVQLGKVMAGIYRSWDPAFYADLCRKFGLPGKKQYKDYSTGMKMKLCMAVALSHHPKLLLLDEATNGLDPVVRDQVTDLLLDFARDEDHSILISSHIVSDLEKLCDTVAFLHKGRLLLWEDKDTLREEYALWQGTAAQLAQLDPGAVYGRRVTPYGVSALVRREKMPAGARLAPVSIEELFVMMVKGENAQ
ncbi:MAG: ABC transporter ATP-binding protein [Faecalibacterium prausnitzii]|nr:ABC transporter ATP-binding protein [Faecalibacterium prausnitzii]MDD7152259.1 ABC transporter ATP-binding protein [Faecalibacterium prausnitzii]MDY2681384.1 ABC transporter ATP-binding protein [Faecalibacterium prausnitzii]